MASLIICFILASIKLYYPNIYIFLMPLHCSYPGNSVPHNNPLKVCSHFLHAVISDTPALLSSISKAQHYSSTSKVNTNLIASVHCPSVLLEQQTAHTVTEGIINDIPGCIHCTSISHAQKSVCERKWSYNMNSKNIYISAESFLPVYKWHGSGERWEIRNEVAWGWLQIIKSSFFCHRGLYSAITHVQHHKTDREDLFV